VSGRYDEKGVLASENPLVPFLRRVSLAWFLQVSWVTSLVRV
jgi:hypothetical protein